MEGTRTKPPRTIVGGASLDTPDRARAYVASVQRDLNIHLRRLGAPTELAVDGLWDDDTQLAFERVCRILGVEPERKVRTFRLITAAVAEKTAAETARARSDGEAFEKELRAQFASNGSAPAPTKRPRTVVGGRSLPKAERAAGLRRGPAARPQPPPHRARLADRPRRRRPVGRATPTSRSGACAGCSGSTTSAPFGRSGRSRAPPRRSPAPSGRERTATATAYAAKLRHHFAHAPVPEKPKPPKPPDPPPGTQKLEAALRAAGARYEDAIVREARRHGVPVSLVCAVLEVETGFQNVFGHDEVRNPVKSPPRGLLVVTEARYRQYLKFRDAGPRQPGRRPDAAHEPRPAGPRRHARRLLEGRTRTSASASSTSPATSSGSGCGAA